MKIKLMTGGYTIIDYKDWLKFKNKKEAAIAYNEAAKKLFKEHAALNEVKGA